MDPGAATEHADVRNIRNAAAEQFKRGLPSKVFPRSAIQDVRRVGQGLSPESHGHTGVLEHSKSEPSESLIHSLSFPVLFRGVRRGSLCQDLATLSQETTLSRIQTLC